MMRKVYNDVLDHGFQLVGRPRRIVSLVSSATEALGQMGLIDRVAGVSEYCPRYVPDLKAPVVGQYLNCDLDLIRELAPDLVLLTGGAQRKLGRKLAAAGLPVYALPLPVSFSGILEAIAILGGLVNEVVKARDLIENMRSRAAALLASRPDRRPAIHVELWLGRYMRSPGGLSFIRDLVEMAGGRMIFGDRAEDYFEPDFSEVAAEKPDLHLFFQEPEYEIDGAALVRERGWNPAAGIINSTVERGRNMIQDGPSLLDTAEWLRREILALNGSGVTTS